MNQIITADMVSRVLGQPGEALNMTVDLLAQHIAAATCGMGERTHEENTGIVVLHADHRMFKIEITQVGGPK
jgi:hypothetical protein